MNSGTRTVTPHNDRMVVARVYQVVPPGTSVTSAWMKYGVETPVLTLGVLTLHWKFEWTASHEQIWLASALLAPCA